VLGYRAFVRVAEGDGSGTGGARTRAYLALKELIGPNVLSALFRSQDGRMDVTMADGEA
jgi:hypothetical protein